MTVRIDEHFHYAPLEAHSFAVVYHPSRYALSKGAVEVYLGVIRSSKAQRWSIVGIPNFFTKTRPDAAWLLMERWQEEEQRANIVLDASI